MKRIVLLLILLTFCISNASALVYENPDSPRGLGTSRYSDSVLVCDQADNTINILYTDAGSYSLKIEGLTSTVSDAICRDEQIYFVLEDGRLYKTDSTSGLLNFSDSQDYQDHFLLLADLDTGSYHRDLVIDPDGKIYVNSEDEVKFLTPPTYSVSTYLSLSDDGISGAARVNALALHPQGIAIGTYDRIKNYPRFNIGIYNGSGFRNLYSRGMGSTTRYVTYYAHSITSDSSGNIYCSWYQDEQSWGYTGHRYHEFEYNSTSDTFIEDFNSASTAIYDMHVNQDGIIYHANSNDIDTHSTIGLVSGYTGEPLPPLSGNVSWSEGTGSTYTAGDVATINYSITSMDSSKDYTIQIKTGSGTLKQTYDISSSSGSVTYSFPVDALPGSYFAGIYEQDTKLDGDHCYLENPNYNYNIGFSKEQYSPGEWVVINYEGLTPEMDLILANDDAFDDSDILQNWTKSGNGQVSYHLSDDYAQDGMNLILKRDGSVLAQDYADVVTQDTNLLYGTVYDASTGSRIENAHVNVGGTVMITDSDGQYNYMTATGTYDVTVSKDGYLPVNQYVVIEGQTKRDFFLTPETGSSDIYGTVRDQDTGDPIPQATIFVSGPSYGGSTFTSGTGYFSLDGLTPDEEYSISATASGYESYISTFTATNNSTDLSFNMYPSGTGGGGSDTDQPTIEDHREAAKQTLYETYGIVPSIFMLVLFFLVFQIISRGMK